MPAVTFPAEERHRPSAGTKLYCLVTEAHACEQLAQGCYLKAKSTKATKSTQKRRWLNIEIHEIHKLYEITLAKQSTNEQAVVIVLT